MTCLLKRILPFSLCLTTGIALWIVFVQATHITCPLSQNYGGIGIGSGAGSVGRTTDKGIDDAPPFSPQNVDRQAHILRRLEPQYTEKARLNRTEGTVVLRAVVAENGWLTNIRVVSGLPDGLSDKAFDAARQTKFSPAIKDGHPVSQYIQLEYDFNLY